MKTTLIILLLASAANASDIRMVGGISVDLEPVRVWLKKSNREQEKTERPLSHWKEIKITKVLSTVGTQATCEAYVDGDKQQIILRNAPAMTVKAAAEVTRLENLCEAHDKTIAEQVARIARLEANTYDSNRYAPVVNVRTVENAKADLLVMRRTMRSLEEKLEAAEKVLWAQPTELAMKTGLRYNDTDIWDCGVKK